MKRLFLCGMLAAIFVSGCAKNYYNIPTDNFAVKVRSFGVAPIIIDTDSDIRHPQKDLLIQLVNDLDRKYEQQLTRKLKATGNFSTVALLDSDPGQLLGSLVFRRERRDDAGIKYNKYFWKNEELRSYIQKNNLDAVMLVIISGLTRTDKIYSRDLLNSLESEYNYLTLAAQILDANGTVLWEYPNFRQRILSYSPLISLQYPDFSESDANLSKSTEVKFKTLDGIRRTLEKKRKDWMLRETAEPESYGNQFDEIVSLVKYDLSNGSKNTSTAKELTSPGSPDVLKPFITQPAPAQTEVPASSNVTTLPKASESGEATTITTESPEKLSDEIVPATGSTR